MSEKTPLTNKGGGQIRRIRGDSQVQIQRHKKIAEKVVLYARTPALSNQMDECKCRIIKKIICPLNQALSLPFCQHPSALTSLISDVARVTCQSQSAEPHCGF